MKFRINTLKFYGFMILLCMPFSEAWARCYKVTQAPSNNPGNSSIHIGEGQSGPWSGACGTCNGNLGLPSVVNLSNGSLVPHGTLLASSIAPFIQYGQPAGYDPERVFTRCAPGEDIYEMYSTNGDNRYSGYGGSPKGDTTGRALGLEAAYDTVWDNILLRLSNVTTGEYITDIWKERLLTDLDVDSRGYRLVKAKNLSTIRADLFSAGSTTYHYYNSNVLTRPMSYSQPNAYIALRGNGLAGPKTGVTHASDITGWHGRWPGAIGLYGQVTLKRYPTCVVLNATPYVLLPTIQRSAIENGETSEAVFQISFKCENAMVSGIANNNTALGIMVSSGAFSAASNLGLVNASAGVSHLVSDNYGAAGMAEGVGIRILRDNTPIILLSTQNSGFIDGTVVPETGWLPVVGNASQLISSDSGMNQYIENFIARLEKLPGSHPVTSGKVRATANVIIRVQ
ncbi:fimbrial protein [Halomonas citrativorans]|nr:fimbrial protein [Halomonas citrativorans]